MLHRNRQNLLGKNYWEVFPNTLGLNLEQQFRQAMKTQTTTRFEDLYLDCDAWFDVHAYPTAVGLAVYFQDITQRRVEQAQLRLLETAVARLNDIVIITDAESLAEPGPRIVFVNEAFERRTGYGREEVIGKSPRFLQGPKTQRVELDRIGAALEKRQPVRAELINYKKSGEAFWLDLDIVPIADGSGVHTHFVSVERDITKRKRSEEEFRNLYLELDDRVQQRTAELQVVNKALEAFSYSVSHDLRSPLSTVAGFSKLLEKSEGKTFSAKGRHYLNRIQAGATQMSELIEGLMSLAQLSQDQLTIEPVDLSEIARKVVQECRERDPDRVVEVVIQEDLQAHGDSRLLASVLQNLLGNAWKFTAKKPSPYIEFFGGVGPEGEIIYAVKDNGAGFDMALVDRLFATFQRLHSASEFSGTGVGLTTVKRIVEKHGGKVWAESKVGNGATFFFTLNVTAASIFTVGLINPKALARNNLNDIMGLFESVFEVLKIANKTISQAFFIIG